MARREPKLCLLRKEPRGAPEVACGKYMPGTMLRFRTWRVQGTTTDARCVTCRHCWRTKEWKKAMGLEKVKAAGRYPGGIRIIRVHGCQR